MSATAIVKTGKYVYDKLKQLEERNTRPFRESAAEEYLSEYSHALAARVERLEDGDEVRARIDETVTDEFLFLMKNYEFEAIREARKERRRMLAYAAAGALALGFKLSDLTRVERALRSLEPEDVMVLVKLAEQVERPFDPAAFPEHQHQDRRQENEGNNARARANRYAVAKSVPLSLDGLMVAGCMRLEDPNMVGVSAGLLITEVGRLVLNILDDYVTVARAEGLMGKAWGDTNVT